MLSDLERQDRCATEASPPPQRRARPWPHQRHGVNSAEAAPGKKNGLLLFVLLIAQLMVILDITAVNIALPSLAGDLGLTGSDISWTITSYTLVFGSLLLFGGRAADLIGRRRMFLIGLGIFTASSFASALAGTADALFAARAGQGLGAAMLSPAALAIIMSAFQGTQRAKALAAWGAVGGAGAAIGVLVGGLLTEFTDWRMIFYVNLPVAAALAIAALKSSRPTPGSRAGTVSTCAALCLQRRASARSSSRSRRPRAQAGPQPRRSCSASAVSPVSPPSQPSSSAPTRRSSGRSSRRSRCRRRRRPDACRNRLDLRPLPAHLALPAERARDGAALYRPRLHPARARGGIGAHAAGHIVSKHGVRAPLAGAFLVSAVGMTLLAHVGENGSYLRDVLPGMLVAGVGLGVAVVSVSIAILTGAREEETGMISGLNSTGHEIGGTIGIAIFATIAAGSGAIAGPQAASGIAHAFIAAGLLASVASLVALAVLPRARHFVPKLRLNPSAMPSH